MDLYILRHAIAEDASKTGKDRDRNLTPEGIEKTKASAAALKRLDIQFDLILTSPFKRTVQTAEIIAIETGTAEPQFFPPLSSGESSSLLIDSLQRVDPPGNVLIVGHEPDLGNLISILLSGSDKLGIAMKKGALCKLHCLRIAPGMARLEWLLTAKHLVKMA